MDLAGHTFLIIVVALALSIRAEDHIDTTNTELYSSLESLLPFAMLTNITRKVASVMKTKPQMEGAGVLIGRTIGSAKLGYFDPFLLLDEFRSDKPGDYLEGFPDHPHRGFETVTYMLEGIMEHRDHTGNRGVLNPGAVQWMTAGRGIVHSEMPIQKDGLMHGYQMWVNLPKKDKMCGPRYQDIQNDKIPVVKLDNGVSIKIMAGESQGVQGAISGISTAPTYLDISVPANTHFTHPTTEGHNAWCFVITGSAKFGPQEKQHSVEKSTLVLWERDGKQFEVQTESEPARFLFAAARPLNEPMSRYGPFVMNTREEIMQAFQDFQSGKFK
eukprot:TRINITY_DN3983_c0_g1_i3.p1 TRINITY_DN3983_c0_g1~~TRINITY_DN3983_c0_g1_i3.p1  ORF type:complete len:347 (+),score=46.04 TRINITY_DN3983_c0_g1_i3:57-1043(+)